MLRTLPFFRGNPMNYRLDGAKGPASSIQWPQPQPAESAPTHNTGDDGTFTAMATPRGVARYTGKGSIDDAENFRCSMHF
jgi:hypothetical protein